MTVSIRVAIGPYLTSELIGTERIGSHDIKETCQYRPFFSLSVEIYKHMLELKKPN
jgi:hypothetical protein